MADAVTSDPAQIKRSELRRFLPTDDLVRRFEKLLRVAGQTTPQAIAEAEETITVIETQIVEIVNTIESSGYRAVQALDLISRVKGLLELENLKPPVEEVLALDDLKPPGFVAEELDDLKPVPVTGSYDRLDYLTEGYEWDDVYPSAASIGKGASAPVSTVYLTGSAFDFIAPVFPSAAPTKEMTLQFQIYHSYAEGTDLECHLHLYVPDDVTGGDIVFDYEYSWENIGDTGAPTTTPGSVTLTRGASAGIASNLLLEILGSVAGAGMRISSIFSITISRDVADSFGSSVWLLSADCHIRKNSIGSRQEGIK